MNLINSKRFKHRFQQFYIVSLTSLAAVPTAQSWAQETTSGFTLSSFQGASRDITALNPQELATALNAGDLTSRQLVLQFMERIQRLDHSGPTLRSVTQINPDALKLADEMDIQRALAKSEGRTLPPLFGIPILVKNNIDTNDEMYYTAGSLALIGSRPAQDSMVAAQLRQAGVLIMGKTNMSEWANYRGGERILCQQKNVDGSCNFNGADSSFSGQGGVVLNPWGWRKNASGSSHGSGVATIMDFAPISLGSETNGSIIGPSITHGLIGLKPTPGLTSRTGVTPALFSTDTVGPMGENIYDIAQMLGSMNKVDSADAKSASHPLDRPTDYTRQLNGDLTGLRVGIYNAGIGQNSQGYVAAVNMLVAAGATYVLFQESQINDLVSTAIQNTRKLGKFSDSMLNNLASQGMTEYSNQVLSLASSYETKKHIDAYLNSRIAAPEQYKSTLVRLLGPEYKKIVRSPAESHKKDYVTSTADLYTFNKNNRALELGRDGDNDMFERTLSTDIEKLSANNYEEILLQAQQMVTTVMQEFRRLLTDNSTSQSGVDATVGSFLGYNSKSLSQIAQLTMPLMSGGNLEFIEMQADPFQEETLLRMGYALEQQLKMDKNAVYRLDKSKLVQQAWEDQPIDIGPPLPVIFNNLDKNGDLWTARIAPLVLNAPDVNVEPVFEGRFHGLGNLIKTGPGLQMLTGNSDFVGPVQIWEGGLKITQTEALGDITNTVTLKQGSALVAAKTITLGRDIILDGSGTLAADADTTFTIDKPITDYQTSAASTLIKSGLGTLVLSAANTYTGPTWINNGVLAIDGSVMSTVSVNQGAKLGGNGVLGALLVNAGGTVAPGHSIGTLHTGDVTFNVGSRYAVEVAEGGRSDLIESSGIATLNGGEVTVSLENSANLLTLDEAKPLIGQTFNILTAKKGIVGQFSAFTPNYLFLDSQLGFPPTQQVLTVAPPPTPAQQPVVVATPQQPVQAVPDAAPLPAPVQLPVAVTTPEQLVQTVAGTAPVLTPAQLPVAVTTPEQPTPAVPAVTTLSIGIKRNRTSFASVALTRNERAVAIAADTLNPGNPVYESLLTSYSAEQARQAFKQLDGQVHSDIAAAQLLDSRYLRDAVNARLQQAQALNTDAQIQVDETNGGWVQLIGGHGQVDTDHNATSYSTSTTGVLLGLDTDVGDGWRAGMATGYTKTDLNGSSRTSADSDNYHLSVYGGKRFDSIALRLGGGTTWHHFDTSRGVVYGNQLAHENASYGARSDQVFGEVGYTGWSAFEPFANLTYINLQSDSFKARGKAAALHASKQSQDATVSTLGLRSHMQLPVSATQSVNLRGELGWEHQYGKLDRETSLKFSGSETAFAVNSVPVSRDGAVVKATAEMAMTKDTLVSLNYTGLVSSHGGGSAVNLGFTFQF